MRVIVHGGAGGVPDEPEPRQATLDEAAETGAASETPVDAVEAAVRVLETDPAFNAGVGGAVQSDGVVRTDAGLMTSDRDAGAAAGMAGVEHAVSVARAVMEETPHVLVAGDPAVDLASDFGVETDCDLFTEETRARWDDADPPAGSTRDHLAWLDARFGETTADPTDESDLSDHDTVGVVASDGETFAAATSTGGRWFALAGRVGDVPQIGSGFYAAAAGGASATGAGEDIAKTTLSRRAVRHLERGLDAQTAAETAIDEFGELTGSEAGVIVLDDEGVGRAFNSEGMQTSVAEK
ncbi:isoaspartyl peptidase/L-asparaginase [Halopelagius longus]|uniref:Plant-type L-asparaginase n=1 Tax=Halopelagius longus TaxID=1236180 RepID=A0A1H0YGX2_9EURY|nr:isoaspartyl peptidase/L-asparaginase [Halopelagius longus]RDI72488.1 asparaginase [Halopelagius longus]SDQ14475.1 beta-aspartyl-peptidase (threonine type) [Halopelagius longus]